MSEHEPPQEIPHEDENRLMAERRRKAEELRAEGQNPYANGFSPSTTCAALRERFGAEKPREGGMDALVPERFSLAVRILTVRQMGKMMFVRVRDRSGELQVAVKKDTVGEAAFDLFKKKLERGDFVGFSGFVTITKTGELTLVAESLTPLTKAIRPLPEKWHGLSDVETRYRQRYVDLVCNPEVAETFRARSKIVRKIRDYFDRRDFLEVETPMMHPIIGGAAARPFATHHNALDIELFMRIAPELYLKRLVVGGFERVYEINRNFRNEGLSRQHNPEFTMLEFYCAYWTYEDLMACTEELFCELARDCRGGLKFKYGEHEVDFTPPWPRRSIAELVRAAGAPDPLDDSPDGVERLRHFCNQIASAHRQPPVGKAASWGELLGFAFDTAGEALLDPTRPTFVVDYPTATSPLSRMRDGDPRFVDRFELFVVGREHANGFSELNDPDDQRARFRAQVDAKARGAEETMDYDEDYCRALEYGMPPTAGEGIGIDRLAMLLADAPSIRDVILFPQMRPEK